MTSHIRRIVGHVVLLPRSVVRAVLPQHGDGIFGLHGLIPKGLFDAIGGVEAGVEHGGDLGGGLAHVGRESTILAPSVVNGAKCKLFTFFHAIAP
jgi:hypothetical protein